MKGLRLLNLLIALGNIFLSKYLFHFIPISYGRLAPSFAMILDTNKVRFARLKLRSKARDFWHSIENHRKGRSKPAITDWNEMKQILREKYVPQCYQEI